MTKMQQTVLCLLFIFALANTALSQGTFTIGSTREEVRIVQGTPDNISRYSALGCEVWRYGYSSVEISSRDGCVIEWTNTGNLRVALRPGINVTSAQFFTQGSHKDDVLRLQGTPDDISRYAALGCEVWRYGYSSVEISTRDGCVIEWTNTGNLRVTLRPGINVTSARFFTQGSHKDDVLRLQGTPDDISRYSALGCDVWRYGYSSVEISISDDRVIKWTNTGNLLVAGSAARHSTTYGTNSLAPPVAENGDVRGVDNDGDGRIEPVYVRGYYRKDGTYVRSHYRARPRRK